MVKCPQISVGEAWDSIQELGKKRPGIQNLIESPGAKDAFLQSPARKTWDDLFDREDHALMPGELTRGVRVRSEGIKQDLVAGKIPLNLIRSLFLRYWLFKEAPEIYNQCKRVLEGSLQTGAAIARQEIENAGLWEETESYAFSNITLQLAAKRKSFRDRIIRTLPENLEIPIGISPENYEALREIVAGRVQSALRNKKEREKKDPLLISIAEWLEQRGGRAVDGVGVLEQGLILNKQGNPTSSQEVLNLAAKQLNNILISGVRTCYKNASLLRPDLFPHSEGRGVGPTSSLVRKKKD